MRVVEGVTEVEDVAAFVASLDEIADRWGCTVQAFDARYVVDRAHLERAVELADRAFERGENVARDRGVEMLLYAAGRRQIDQALELGVSEGTVPVAVVVDAAARHAPDDHGESPPGDESAAESDAADAVAALLTPASTLGDYDPALVTAFFDVGERERAVVAGGLPDLVRERVALLDVEK